MLGLLSPNRYESDLSYEVLYALAGQEAAKILEAKVGGRWKIADSDRIETAGPWAWLIRQIFFDVQL